MTETKLPHIVIVGAGFGGLRAARSFAGKPVKVTLLDRNNFHLFQPLLYQVATGGLSPNEIAYPVRGILGSQKNLEFRMAEVTGVDRPKRIIQTDKGPIAYDYLILAIGGQTNYFGMRSVAEHAFGLKNIDDATRIRNHLLCMFEAASQETDPAVRSQLLTFVVVGGGPTGVECAGAISELSRMVISRDYRTLKKEDVQVILLEGIDRVLANLPPDLSEAAAQALQRKHVRIRFGTQVTDFNGQRVQLKDGSEIPSYTVVWAAGVRAAGLANTLESAQGAQARLVVTPELHLPEDERVYCIGDAAYQESEDGKPLPMVAPVAMQQGQLAASNILHAMAGEPQQSFTYKDPGSLATIGRNQAVAQLGRFKFRGFFAWIVWLVVHIMQLIGFRNRLVVLINWAWDYLFYDRVVRLISPE